MSRARFSDILENRLVPGLRRRAYHPDPALDPATPSPPGRVFARSFPEGLNVAALSLRPLRGRGALLA